MSISLAESVIKGNKLSIQYNKLIKGGVETLDKETQKLVYEIGEEILKLHLNTTSEFELGKKIRYINTGIGTKNLIENL